MIRCASAADGKPGELYLIEPFAGAKPGMRLS